MIKKIILGILIIAALLWANYYEHHYTRKNCVAVETTETGVIFKDQCGYKWYWEESGFQVGDVVNLKMHDYNTSHCIDDDVIKQVVRVE